MRGSVSSAGCQVPSASCCSSSSRAVVVCGQGSWPRRPEAVMRAMRVSGKAAATAGEMRKEVMDQGSVRAGGSGLPGADAVQAAELLVCGGRVEALAACGEAVGDGGAVLDGLIVVVLELGLHVGDFQAQAADAGQHPAVGGLADGDGGVVAVRLEVGELAA